MKAFLGGEALSANLRKLPVDPSHAVRWSVNQGLSECK
jgi:hypothetical protein